MDFRTVTELSALLQARQVSALELTESAIRRIEAHDGRLNAVVVRDFQRARAAAGEADAALGRGERRPLLGVPMTVKECADVAGLPTTWGIPGTETTPAAADAVAVARLKAAGAIVLGKTNVPLHLADWQSYNAIYGTTSNPWDTTLSPGGSSGGAAAALAAGYVALELGTDIGGSLRVPASFCGVFAHKPTWGIVPMRGIAPPGTPALSIPVAVDLAVAGPMARCAADLELALGVVAGPDDADAVALRLALPPPRHGRLQDFRVLVVDEHPLLPTAAEVRAALGGIAEGLQRCGARVERSTPLLPDLAHAGRVYTRLLMAVFGADLDDDVYARRQTAAARLAGRADSLDDLRAAGVVMTHRDWLRTDHVRLAIADRWRRLFQDFDVLLCPVMPTPAFAHDHGDFNGRRITVDGAEVPYVDQTMWPSLATLTGLPATAMPAGRSEGGLPIGMQIVGPAFEDRTTLAFSGLLEREFGGFAAPPAL